MDKICKQCGLTKPLDDFYSEKGCRDGRRPECKACTGAKRKRWYSQNREREIARVKAWQQANAERHNASQRTRRERPEVKARNREGHLKRKFGITQQQYEELLAAQGGGCAVCSKRPPAGKSLHVDHDHHSGTRRGLLCFSCNAALGHLRDSPDRIDALMTYLLLHDPVAVAIGDIEDAIAS